MLFACVVALVYNGVVSRLCVSLFAFRSCVFVV